NPGASTGAVVSRQVVSYRDMNADGLADLVVGGGLNVGGNLTLGFNNRAAQAYINPYATHGLLARVYLATNPQAANPSPDRSKANYSLSYGQSAPSVNDPQSRQVLSEVIVRDGVPLDEADEHQVRRTCHSYEGGYYDRFERRFLGFERVVTV